MNSYEFTMNAKHSKPITLPAWAMPAAPSRSAIFEVFALAGLEGQWVRLDAAQQRALMGHPVFGRQAFRVMADGEIEVMRVTCFGADFEAATYEPARVQAAAAARKRLSPGTFGPNYA
jgi:hypothetical protein